jgi:hypothetical protein
MPLPATIGVRAVVGEGIVSSPVRAGESRLRSQAGGALEDELLRRQALREEDEAQGRWVQETA